MAKTQRSEKNQGVKGKARDRKNCHDGWVNWLWILCRPGERSPYGAGEVFGAHILLVNPYGPEATSRINAILHPHFTLEKFRKEVRESIALLRRLKVTGKAVKLKLYSDPPLVKLAILGDYLWLKHYHTELDEQTMPEYVFQHNLNDHRLYNLFYQWFIRDRNILKCRNMISILTNWCTEGTTATRK